MITPQKGKVTAQFHVVPFAKSCPTAVTNIPKRSVRVVLRHKVLLPK